MGNTNVVQRSLRYWIKVNADGTIAAQSGEALIAVGIAASVYTLTLPASHLVPKAKRFVEVTADVPVASLGNSATYDDAASADNTIVIRGAAFGGGASNTAFSVCVFVLQP